MARETTSDPADGAGIARIGPVKSGMLSNLQPVTSIVAAPRSCFSANG